MGSCQYERLFRSWTGFIDVILLHLGRLALDPSAPNMCASFQQDFQLAHRFVTGSNEVLCQAIQGVTRILTEQPWPQQFVESYMEHYDDDINMCQCKRFFRLSDPDDWEIKCFASCRWEVQRNFSASKVLQRAKKKHKRIYLRQN